MKSINEVNLLDYQHFYLTEETEPFTLLYSTPSGDVVDSNCELIKTDTVIIIGLKDTTISGIKNYFYMFNGIKKHVQILDYDSATPFITGIDDTSTRSNFNFYKLSDSVKILSGDQYVNMNRPRYLRPTGVPDSVGRCDDNKYGPISFHPFDESYILSRFRGVLDIAGVMHISYVNTLNDDFLNPTSRDNNCTATTLTGVIKLAYEWSLMAEEPFNSTENIAIKCKQFFEQIQIPPELMEWILENQTDKQVFNYLNGETRMIYPSNENTEIPECLVSFIKSKCMYRSISSLIRNHPKASLLSDDFITDYRQSIEKKIYETSLECGVDDFSPESVQWYVETEEYGHYQSLFKKYLDLLQELS